MDLERLYSESATGHVTDAQIAAMITDIEDTIDVADLSHINQVFADADVTRLNLVFMVGLARHVFVARDQLPAWKPYVEAARIEIERRGRDPKRMLMGLI